MRRGGNRMLTRTITEFYRKKTMVATQSGRFASYLSYLVFAFGLLMLKAGNTYGQQYYPVQVRSFIQSPSVYVEDYYNPDNFRVQVTLTDLMMPSLDVLLKVTIQSPSGGQFVSGQGIRLTLTGGLTYTLIAEDLKELLSSRNLSGLPSSLQEGTYVFNFSVFDAATMFPVSNPQTDFASAIVLLNDPPLLTSPANGEVLDPELSGQNYMFSWTPRSFSLNPQEQVKYRLVIARIPAGRNPYDAFLTNAFVINQPFEDIAFNSFFYSPDFLPLQPGATYAWQITAYEERLISNVPEKVSMRFRNQGRSDVFTFTVKEHCPALFLRSPELRQHPQTGANSILLGWNYDPAHNLYEIRYRPAGSNQTWTVQQQSGTELFLGADQLVRGKTYEYTVACLCNTWQEPVAGGTFQLPGGECEAPYPILVSSNDANGITLSWEPVAAAGSYKVTYTDLLSGQSSQADDLQEPAITLPPLTAGGYTIRIDAVCGSTAAQGEELRLDYDEKHIAGGCPLPRPFTFLAHRPEAGTVHHEARLSWPSLSIHESWQLTYWHKDSVDYPHTATAGSPELLVSYIADNEFYHYRLQYTCKGGKTVTTPNGGFRVDAVDGLTTVTPGTADCFPPAVHSAEARSESSARIDWQGVKGAEEYVVAYQPADGSGQEKIFITSAANARLTGLTLGIVYQYEIRCRCGGQYSIASVPGEFDLSQLYSNNKCDTIAQLAINQVTETEIQLAWTWPQPLRPGYDAHTSYTIRYKENGQDWPQAYTIDYHPDQDMLAQYEAQSTFKKTIDQLSPGTTYDIEVRARCGTEAARTNDIISGTTKEPEAPDCSRGGSCDRTSLTPVEKLEAGDTIQVADYSVLLKTIEKDNRGDNLWKGTGLAEAPMIGFSEYIRFDVDFDSLFVNDQICVVGGRMDLNINVQLLDEATKEKIEGLMAKTGALIDQAKKGSKAVADGVNTAQEYGNKAFEYFHGGGDAGRVKSGGLGDISVSGDVSGMVTYDGYFTIDDTQYPVGRYPVLVKDQNGQVYAVDKGKSPVNIGHYDERLKGFQDSLASSDYIVTFSPNKKARYAFDVWQDAYLKSVAMVPHYLSLGGKYHSAKAILPAEVDPVSFELSGGNKNKLVFVNRDGFVFKTDGNTLNLVGGPAKDAQEVLALYNDGTKKVLAGALLLPSYPHVEKKVVIVPVLPGRKVTRDAKAIEEQLNKAYNPVGIYYTVAFDLSFAENRDWCENGNCDFASGGSGLLSNNYTGVEARVIDAYLEAKGADSLDEATAYLFAINITKAGREDEALEGKMNFEKQFGFLYAFEGQSNAAIGRTLAHELGHGNYKLHHIFDGMYLGDAARNSDNLMSYSTRTDALALNKLQWDVIHDPGVTWGVFKRDRDQEAKPKVALSNEGIGEFLEQIHDMRVAGLNMDFIASKVGEVKEYKNTNVTLKDGNTYSIKLRTESFAKSYSYNPAIYEDYYYDGFALFNDYGVCFKNQSGKIFITIIAGSESERNQLKDYLFGTFSHMDILTQIHNASANNRAVNITYPTNGRKIEILKNQTINGVVFDTLFCSFEKLNKGESARIEPNDPAYHKPYYGFNIEVTGSIVYSIRYYRRNLTNEVYEANLKKLEEWLFGKNEMLTMKIYSTGRIIQYVPKEIQDVFNVQFNDPTYAGNQFEVRYEYHENGDSIELGTYTYFLTTNQYINDARYGSTTLVDLIDVRQIDQEGFNLNYNSQSNRYYMNLKTLGSLLCAMRNSGNNDLTFNGFSNIEGLSVGGSSSHKNGFNGDLRYLRVDQTGNQCVLSGNSWQEMDEDRQNLFNDLLHNFRWHSMLSQYFNKNKLLNHTTHDTKQNHYDHLHIQGYSQDLFEVIYE